MDPNNMRRFDDSRLLSLSMPEIRERYKSYLQDGRTESEIELGLALYMQDKLAIPIDGGRQDVGILDLKKKHIQLVQPFLMKLSFLDNMSLPYEKQVYCGPDVFEAAQRHLEGKMLEDFVFTKVTSAAVNSELGLHKDTVASELFKTIHASGTCEKMLYNYNSARDTQEQKASYFMMVQKELPILLDHRRRRLPNDCDAELSMMNHSYQGLKKEIKLLEEVAEWRGAMKRMGRLLSKVEKKHLLEKKEREEINSFHRMVLHHAY